MRTSLIALFSSCILMSPKTTVAESSTVKGSSGGVTLEVVFQHSYPSSSDLIVSHTITNVSGGQIKTIRATDTYDLSIRLLGPDGNVIEPFPRNEKQFKRFMIADLLPGQTQSDSLNLAVYYPITEIGEYRCSVTRQVYDAATIAASDITRTRPGTPLNIASPEFRFRVASIDPSFKSPHADATPKSADAEPSTSSASSSAQAPPPSVKPSPPKATEAKRAATTASEKPTSSTPWSVVAVLIVAACGLLWLLVKNRK